MPITPEQIADHLAEGTWRHLFDGGALARGSKLARGKQVADTRAEALDTGDVEITSSVLGTDASRFRSTIAIWLEEDALTLEATCTCDVASNCEHNAATLERLTKLERLMVAFGQSPQADQMLGAAKNLQLEPPAKDKPAHAGPQFVIRVERRPAGEDRLDWLPEIYAHAHAIYAGEHQVPLTPSGNTPPIVTPEGKIHRDRLAEMEALQLLYAIDLQPGAEQPPHSLRKIAKPPHDGTLWAPDRKQWPHPEYYWQRFRHEATSALEGRGWKVQFAPHVGHRPLVFRTDSWSAEIVEEGRGWFNLSAGFDIEGERFDLQPILATLVENQFLEATEGMPSGQEFMIFLPDGRGLALPVGRFRNILVTLGALLQFKFGEGRSSSASSTRRHSSADGSLETEAPEEIRALALRASDFQKIERVPSPLACKPSCASTNSTATTGCSSSRATI